MKRPTISSIAELAGVSTAAVSYALNGVPGVSDETRQRILDIANESGWRPSIAARALSISRAHAVGLVIARPARTLGVEPFFMRFIAGLEAELSAQHSALLLQVVEDHSSANRAIRTWWAERRIDGLIVTDLFQADSRLPMIDEIGVPAVLVGRPGQPSDLPSVWSDDAAAVTSVVDYLVGEGHRRIARVAGLPALEHTHVRTRAFIAAMESHGLAAPDVVATDYSWEDGARATRMLLERPERPTAIVYDNDIMAASALSVTRDLGVAVPEQLSLVAGDDSQLCMLVSPPLTALSRDVSAFGSRAAQTLLQVIAGETPSSFQDTTPHLVVRSSTGQLLGSFPESVPASLHP